MSWIVPTAVLGTSVTANPQSVHQESTTNLAANGAVALEFEIEYSPLFDIYALLDQDATLVLEVRQSLTGTYRTIGTWNLTANNIFALAGYRVPGIQARWTLTATGGATATLDIQIFNRSQ